MSNGGPKETNKISILSCGIAELVEHNTLNNNSKQLTSLTGVIRLKAGTFKRLDVIKIKNRNALKAIEEEFQ